jgi:hypothetical protein
MDRRSQRPAFFAYADNYLIDVKFGIIVDVEASRAVRQAEVGAARTMLERTEERFGLKPERLAADAAYGSAPMLNWLVEEKQITPHIPVIDKSKREDGTFSREDFRYDEASDTYACPAGKTLTTSGTLVNDGITLLYLGRTGDCAPCPLKPQCCPKTPARGQAASRGNNPIRRAAPGTLTPRRLLQHYRLCENATRHRILLKQDGGSRWGASWSVRTAARRRCSPSAWTTGSMKTIPSE